MATVNAYLKFKGNTKEALDFYKSAFNGEFLAVIHYKDNPEAAEQVRPEDADKIFFMVLDVGNGTTIMATDVLDPAARDIVTGNNVYIYINTTAATEVDTIFAKLKAGGEVKVEPTSTSWGGYYCELVDRFGISWIINHQRDLGPLSRRP